jgi:hypothetical protein
VGRVYPIIDIQDKRNLKARDSNRKWKTKENINNRVISLNKELNDRKTSIVQNKKLKAETISYHQSVVLLQVDDSQLD